jgi:hypothetical protein
LLADRWISTSGHRNTKMCAPIGPPSGMGCAGETFICCLRGGEEARTMRSAPRRRVRVAAGLHVVRRWCVRESQGVDLGLRIGVKTGLVVGRDDVTGTDPVARERGERPVRSIGRRVVRISLRGHGQSPGRVTSPPADRRSPRPDCGPSCRRGGVAQRLVSATIWPGFPLVNLGVGRGNGHAVHPLQFPW